MTGFQRTVGAAALSLPLLVVSAHADDKRTLVVTGHGEAAAAPDSSVITAGVTTMAATAEEALSQNSAAMQRVFAALRHREIPEKDIQTSNFSVQPQYAPYNANVPARQRITGYQVSNDVTVKIDRAADTGPAIDALGSAGANQINGVSFTIRDPAPLYDQARASAVADALQRARVIAGAAHVSLGQILSISEESAPSPRPMFAMARVGAAAPAPIAAGEETITANVSVTFEIQ